MQPIIYDVAVSADGFIAGPNDDISKFPASGPVVDDYFDRLQTYACAIMGRATYEFGYRFGLQPGANPYPHMRCVVFSRRIELPAESAVEVVREDAEAHISCLRTDCQGPVYLCGGGHFAGWLISLGLIAALRLKRAPILLGGGTRLFGDYEDGVEGRLRLSKPYDDGILFQEFDLAG